MNNPVNYDAIPVTLRTLPHWVNWKYQEVNGKPTKVPYNSRTGGKAQSNNRGTWAAFEVALKTYESGGFDGIGFMLDKEQGIIGVDLDHCLNVETGEVEDTALHIVETLETYTEITPSGAGLRAFCFGELPPSGRKKGNVEFYDSGRFLTVTGRRFGPAQDLRDCNGSLTQLHEGIFGSEKEESKSLPAPIQRQTVDDLELLERMFASKNGTAIRDLWAGLWESHYSSRSEADSALCFHLAFWAGRDPARVDTLFRQSFLMRDKWDESHYSGGKTYGMGTVEKACAKVSESYEERRPPPLLRGRAARAYVTGASDEEVRQEAAAVEAESEAAPATDESERTANKGLYAVRYGRTLLRTEKSKQTAGGEDEAGELKLVCDLAATTVGESTDEDGHAWYRVQGKTRYGRTFEVELDAGKLNDPKYVAGTLKNAAGAGCVFYAGMEKHLAPAIDSFTDCALLEYARRFTRVGWTRDGKEFIIPGMEPVDAHIQLDAELPYRVTVENDLSRGLEALEALLAAQNEQMTLVCLASVLAAPLALPANWRDEKYALFITGRTGSFKTSWTACLLCLYGDFNNEDKLIKFGMGGTANAFISLFADAADMPLMVDNYKPNTGNGVKDAVSLIHAAIEGGEKKRLNRDSTRRATKPIHCWPVFTGEDVIDDAAAIARCLVVPMQWEGGADNPMLTKAQGLSHELPAIGGAWLRWLMSPEGQAAAKASRGDFLAARSQWATRLRVMRPDMVNINRVASNLAVCECAFSIAMECPALATILKPRVAAFLAGLESVAVGMGNYTAQTHEANRYLAAIRAMLATNRAYLCERIHDPDKDDRRIFLGWEDEKAIYLQPDATFVEASRFLRDAGGLNVGMNTIHKQLDQLGHLAKKDGAHLVARKRVGSQNEMKRLVWLRRESVFEDEASQESDESDL